MRNAETVLAVICERGSRGLPVEDVYRQLYNPELYLRAYGKIYGNRGAMTPGTTAQTIDGMSRRKKSETIELLRNERYGWTPVRRTHIPKRNGKTRPLGIPTWSDKLLQGVIREILEAYYEPQFSTHSTASDPTGAVTPHLSRSSTSGGVRSGSSRAISRGASTTSTTRSCCRSCERRSTTTASYG